MQDFNEAKIVGLCANCVYETTVSVSVLPLVYSYHNRSNVSYDVIRKGCFGEFDTIACVRSGVISALAVITAFFCLIKIVRLHYLKHPIWLQCAVFYCALVESVLCAVHWMLGCHVELYFAAEYLKLVQLLAIVHLHWLAAARIFKKEHAVRRLHTGVAFGACIASTALLTFACIDTEDTWTQCLKPYGLALATVELCLVQSLVAAGAVINKRLNEISTLPALRRARKCDLWSLIIIIELSAVTSVAYDVCVHILGNTEDGCSGIFRHLQTIYSPVFGTLAILKFLLPIWALLYAIQPTRGPPIAEIHQSQVLIHEPDDGGSSGWPVLGDNGAYGRLIQPGRSSDNVYPTPPGLTTICEEGSDNTASRRDVIDDRRYIIY